MTYPSIDPEYREPEESVVEESEDVSLVEGEGGEEGVEDKGQGGHHHNPHHHQGAARHLTRPHLRLL